MASRDLPALVEGQPIPEYRPNSEAGASLLKMLRQSPYCRFSSLDSGPQQPGAQSDNGLLAMRQRISQQQLEFYLWGAATLLRGTIDAGDYKQFIFPLLFYKRLCDV